MGAMAQMQPQGMQQGGGQQQQGGHLDWRTIMMAIHRANPGAPPELMFKAVNKLVPMMNSQSMMEWRQMQANLGQQRVETTQRGQDVRAGTAERGQDVRAATAQGAQEVAKRGQDVRAQTAEKAQQGTQERFNIREARITAHQMVTADQGWQKLDQQRKALQARVQQGGEKQRLAEWRAVLDAQHKRATEIIQAWSQQNTMPPETRKQLLKDADEGYNAAIKDMGKGDSEFDRRFQGDKRGEANGKTRLAGDVIPAQTAFQGKQKMGQDYWGPGGVYDKTKTRGTLDKALGVPSNVLPINSQG